MPIRIRHPLVAASLLLAVLSPACRTTGYVFRQDDRIRIVSPARGESVRLPVVVRWSVNDPQGPERFAVFVDRSPMSPGKDLRSVVSDPSCARIPGCPDETTLNRLGVYTTTATEVLIEGLADMRPGGRESAVDRHTVTIVLLDDAGRRLGEAAHTVEFNVDRTSSGKTQ